MRDAAFMGIMRKTLLERLRSELDIPVWQTYGYITKYRREKAGLEKSHTTDALCIANHAGAKQLDTIYTILPVCHHNRQLHKATIAKGGVRKKNQAARYVKGYRLYDKVAYRGQECFIWGRRTSGYFMLKQLDGTKVHNSASYKELKLLERSSNYLIA